MDTTQGTRKGVLLGTCVAVTLAAWIAIEFLSRGAGGAIPERTRGLIFWVLLAAFDRSGAALATAILAASFCLARVLRRPIDGLVSSVHRDVRPWVIAYAVLAVAASWFAYRRYPLCMDEYAPLFQAQAFAEGKIAGQIPPEFVSRVAPAIHDWFLLATRDGRVISAYWPGFALLLAPFVKLGVPWLLNPLIGAATIALLARTARRLLPGEEAGWAVLFALGSPALFVNAISFYSMSAHLLFSLGYAALLIGEPKPVRAFMAGVIGSFALSLHNPAPHALFAAPWLLWLAARPRQRCLGWAIAGYLPLTALLVVGWHLYRSALPLTAQAETSSSAIAVLQHYLQTAFAWPDATMWMAKIASIAKLITWASPALLALAACGTVSLFRRRDAAEAQLKLFAASLLLTVAFYTLFVGYDQGHGWGARYYHSAWAAIPLLACVALRPDGAAFTRRVALTAAVGSLLLATPLRLVQVRSWIDLHRSQLPAAPEAKMQLYFVNPRAGYYSQDLVQNDPFLRSSPVILFSQGERADAAFAASLSPQPVFAGRNRVASVWVVP